MGLQSLGELRCALLQDPKAVAVAATATAVHGLSVLLEDPLIPDSHNYNGRSLYLQSQVL